MSIIETPVVTAAGRYDKEYNRALELLGDYPEDPLSNLEIDETLLNLTDEEIERLTRGFIEDYMSEEEETEIETSPADAYLGETGKPNTKSRRIKESEHARNRRKRTKRKTQVSEAFTFIRENEELLSKEHKEMVEKAKSELRITEGQFKALSNKDKRLLSKKASWLISLHDALANRVTLGKKLARKS